MEAAGKYGDHVKVVLAVLAFPPPHVNTWEIGKSGYIFEYRVAGGAAHRKSENLVLICECRVAGGAAIENLKNLGL